MKEKSRKAKIRKIHKELREIEKDRIVHPFTMMKVNRMVRELAELETGKAEG